MVKVKIGVGFVVKSIGIVTGIAVYLCFSNVLAEWQLPMFDPGLISCGILHPSKPPYNRSQVAAIAVCPDGHIIAAWETGSGETASENRIMARESSDNGMTWGEEYTFHDHPGRRELYGNFLVEGKNIHYLYSTWTGRGEPVYIYMKSSSDNGKSWTDIRQIWSMPGETDFYATLSPRILSNGDWFLPLAGGGSDPSKTEAGYCGYLVSSDKGKTWKKGPMIDWGKALYIYEPAVVEIDNKGKLYMLLRSNGGLMESWSYDYGRTWSKVKRPPKLFGLERPPLLVKLANGHYVLVWSAYSTGVMNVSVSTDCINWSKPKKLGEALRDPDEPFLTNHGVAQLPNGNILAVMMHAGSGRSSGGKADDCQVVYAIFNEEWISKGIKGGISDAKPAPVDHKPGTIPGIASASSESNGAWYANDGMYFDDARVPNNMWASAIGEDTGAWWQVDLGKRHSISKIKVQFRRDVHENDFMCIPRSITFQVSDDGTNWKTIISKSNNVPKENAPYLPKLYEYEVNADGQYVRLLFEEGVQEGAPDKTVILTEVEVYGG